MGDPVLAGGPNEAPTQTALTGGTPDAAALRLANPSPAGPYVAPALRLEPGAGGDGSIRPHVRRGPRLQR